MKRFLFAMAMLWPKNKATSHQPLCHLTFSVSRAFCILVACIFGFSVSPKIGLAAAKCVDSVFYETSTIKPLNIGDTIPEVLWHLPLQVVNHPEGREIITLGEFRDKLIILDFWSTWCGSCIKSLQHGDRLLKGASDVKLVAVSYEQKAIIETFYRENLQLANVELLSVVEDTVLGDIFPHQVIPHLVWINKDGIVVAITSSKQLTSSTLTEFRNNQILNWPVKYERGEMNSTLFGTGSKGVESAPYISQWDQFIPGKPFSHTHSVFDSIEHRYTVQYANHSVYELITKALQRFLSPIPRNRIIGPQELIDRYVFPGTAIVGRDSWYAANAISYEISALVPVSVVTFRERNALIRKYLQEDISRFLGISFWIDTRTMPVLLIKEGMGLPQSLDIGSDMSQGVTLNVKSAINRVNLVSKDILWYEGDSSRTLVFDEIEMEDMNHFIKKLVDSGFTIESAEKEVEVLVINPNY